MTVPEAEMENTQPQQQEVVERIQLAASLAEQAAAALHPGEAGWVEMDREQTQQQFLDDGYELKDARVLAAVGPPFWLALADGLRYTADLHQPETHTKYNIPVFDEFDQSTRTYRRCKGCQYEYSPYPEANRTVGWGCPTLQAWAPVADSIIRDLSGVSS